MSRTTGAQPLELRQGIAGHLRASGDDEKIAIADGMLLLKKVQGEKRFQVVERFEFLNLPVGTRQGELF